MTAQTEETAGLDLFDEAASAAGSFPHSMLGYERAAVDAYVRDVERMLSSTKRKLRAAQRAAQSKIDETDYARLGAHTRDLLRAAEAQAAEMVKAAELESQRMVSAARADSERLILDARQSASQTREAVTADLKRLREDLAQQTEAELASARAQSAALRQAAELHRDQTIAEAQAASAAMRASAAADADLTRQAAAREAAEVRAALAAERAETLASVKAHADGVSATIDVLMNSARQQSEQLNAQLEHDTTTLDQRRQVVLAEAEQLQLQAQNQAQSLIEAAKVRAAMILADAEKEARERNDQLRRETARLQQRKQAIVAQLSGLSSLANRSVAEFPDESGEAAIEDDDDATRLTPVVRDAGDTDGE